MRCYKMTLAYEGTAYCGWQLQPGKATVQGTLEEALQRIVGSRVQVTGSGRTDAGVHALGQVASFRCATRLGPDVLRRAINANTPDDIFVREITEAALDFHAIRCATAKRYRYQIQEGVHRDLFSRAFCWYVPQTLDVERMSQGAEHLLGTHDFRSFEAAGAPRKTSVRTVRELTVQRVSHDHSERMVIEIEANGFLYNMVRNIVGSLVMVGRGERSAEWMRSVLAGLDRSAAGPTAPAHGLTLLLVRYGELTGRTPGGEEGRGEQGDGE